MRRHRWDWDTYYSEGMKEYYEKGDKGWWPAVHAIHDRMAVDDICWTRDLSGNYYIGRILGDWEYCSSDESLRANIANVRTL